MTTQTLIAVKAIVEADLTVDAGERARILGAIKGSPQRQALPRILGRREVAKLLGVSPQRIDQISKNGGLKRICPRGQSRALGYSESAVLALLEPGKGA